jgi:isoleucyl-tRNA synthetase
MPFEKVDPQADFPALERRMLELWDRIHAFEKLKAKNRGKPRWSFLDGPITANNPMGVHHAWGRTYKDAYNRYFAMTGHDLRFQQGFDCQGLWVEVEVEKELKLHNKRDIENLVPGNVEASVDRFVQVCKVRVNKFARVQTEQSIRLGFWMNWDRTDEDWAKPPDQRHSYFTMSEENNYTIWTFLKKCHGRGLIYRGYDSMPWCGRCGVGISEMEMKEGYKLVEHKSVFVKFPLKNRPGENLLVWTTTPWTLTSNVGAAVNPELTYLKVKLKGEIYYLAKGVFKQNRMESSDTEEPEAQAKGKRRDWLDGVPHLNTIEQLFKSKAAKGETYEMIGEVKGADMIGWEYIGPFDDLPAQQHNYGFPADVAKIVQQAGWAPAKSAAESHRIISGGADVSESEGTGIVHTAPGCGAIDFHWGKENGLPPVAPLDESGNFVSGFGDLTGKNAADPTTSGAIFEHLKRKDVLFATERYVHRYPHCWRCKTELLYRLVDEWFINMMWRDEIMDVVKKVRFLPESLNGQARELDWLKNMGDWMISKKRYWGLALPIWVDDKDPMQFEVIGSREELKQRAVEGWPDFDGHTPHRPWVDKVKIRNPKTGNLMSRIHDVGNPWLDAGIVAFSTMKYNTDRDYWQKWYPADFITESFPGQFRNWFYALLAMSTMMSEGQPPFRTLLGHGLVRDEQGREMHKSLGNSIEFSRAAEELGADAMRWLYCRSNPATNLNFGPGPINDVRGRFVIKLWNCYSFFVNYARLDGFDPIAPSVPISGRPEIDRWIYSDLQLLIKKARESFEAYDVMSFCLELERFVDDRLSNWYVRRNRDRFWSKSTDLDEAGKRDKLAAYQTLYTVLRELCKLSAPVIPFLSEAMWQNLRMAGDEESVHLCDYPRFFEDYVDRNLSDHVDDLLRIVSLGLGARNAAGCKIRQPLAEIRIDNHSLSELEAVVRFEKQILDELNVKRVSIHVPQDQLPLLDEAKAEFCPTSGVVAIVSEDRMLRHTVKLNPKTAKSKYKGKPEAAEAALKMMSGDTVLEKMGLESKFTLLGVELGPDDLIFGTSAPDGWAGQMDRSRGTQVMVDIRLTDQLRSEGLARDVIRQVQEHRKNSGLEMQDRIVLYLGTDSEKLNAAIVAHRDHIAAETLATQWSDTPPGDFAEVKIEGQPLKIALKKIS